MPVCLAQTAKRRRGPRSPRCSCRFVVTKSLVADATRRVPTNARRRRTRWRGSSRSVCRRRNHHQDDRRSAGRHRSGDRRSAGRDPCLLWPPPVLTQVGHARVRRVRADALCLPSTAVSILRMGTAERAAVDRGKRIAANGHVRTAALVTLSADSSSRHHPTSTPANRGPSLPGPVGSAGRFRRAPDSPASWPHRLQSPHPSQSIVVVS